jgi:REP element-mobilizing transposase RayT
LRPLAYHITWGTYGTRLHGDRRGTVDRIHNEFKAPIVQFEPDRWEAEVANLKFPPVRLTCEQRLRAEPLFPEICNRGHWEYLACAAAPDHIHLLLKSTFDPQTFRKLAKRWLGQELSKIWTPNEDNFWWSECGSIKWITDNSYLDNARRYIHRQRTSKDETQCGAKL